MSARLLVLSLTILAVMAGCANRPVNVEDKGEHTLAYSRIVCEDNSGVHQVGWLERVGRDDGVPVTIGLVKNMDYEIRGYLRSEGMAVKYVDKAPAYKSALGESRHYIELPRATREYLVTKILDLPDGARLKFPKASVSDIR